MPAHRSRTNAAAASTIEPFSRRGQFVAGARKLVAKVRKYQPTVLAVLGVGAYRLAFHDPTAQVGPQEKMIGGTRLWVLPNPSGLNAHYQADALTKRFAALRREVTRA